MGTDVFLLTKPAGSNSIQRACSQATQQPISLFGWFSREEVSNSRDNIKCCIIDYFFLSQYGVKADYHREVRLVILIVYLDDK